MCLLQAAGARVVPIQYDLSKSELRKRCVHLLNRNSSKHGSSGTASSSGGSRHRQTLQAPCLVLPCSRTGLVHASENLSSGLAEHFPPLESCTLNDQQGVLNVLTHVALGPSPWCRFNAINGLLLPGGGANLSPGHPFYDTAATLVDMALEANDKGDYFPVSCAVQKLAAVSARMLTWSSPTRHCCSQGHQTSRGKHRIPGLFRQASAVLDVACTMVMLILYA